MSNEDQNTGTPEAEESTALEAPAPESAETTESTESTAEAPETEVSPISDALSAINSELNGDPSAPAPKVGAPKGKPRVYDDLEPDELPAFKHMRNEVYDVMYPKFTTMRKQAREQEAIKQQLADAQKVHLYEQEGAWQLAPEYKELVQKRDRCSVEADFWQQQLENINAGEKWQPLMMDANGKLFAGEPQDPTPRATSQIMANLTKSQNYQMALDGRIETYETGFKTKHQGYLSSLKSMEDKVLTKEQQASLKPHVDKQLQEFPAYLRGKPEVVLSAKLLVLNRGLIAVIRELKSQAGGAATKKRIAKAAGPGGGQTSAGAVGGDIKTTLNKFHEVLDGR